MADVKTNEIFTRIQLKYDSYKNWVDNNPTLLSGEVAIAKLVNDVTVPVEEAKNAPVLFKVGPGAFNDLPWVSGLAADVYAWAKKATPDWTDFPALPLTVVDEGTGKFVTDFTYADNKLTITRSDVDWKDVKNAPDFALKSELPTRLGVMSVTGKDAIVTTGDKDVEVTLKIAATQGEGVTVTQNTDGLKVEVAHPTDHDTKTVVTAGDGIEVTPTINGEERSYEVKHGAVEKAADLIAADRTYVTGLTFDAFGHVTGVTTGIETVEDTNTAHTHTAGAGIKLTGNGGIDGDVKYELNVAFELVDKKIKLYDKADSTKAAIAELDATEFIADGMLASVTADQANNKLVFEWNTDAGVTKTEVELSSIADIYTGVTNTETATTVKNTNEIEVTLVNDGVTEAKLEKNVRDALALARTALQEHQSLDNYKTKQTAVADKGLTGAKVLGSLTQNENGEIDYTVRDLTPADIGAQVAGDYKTVQEAKEFAGATTKTVTDVKQNANGEVEVTYGDIAFPEAIKASGAATIATVADDVVTLKAGAVLGEDHVLANDANADITLAKIAKTGNIDDLVQTTGTYIVFNCGTSTTVI